MAAVTICSDFGVPPPQMKSDTVSTVVPSISHEVMETDAMISLSLYNHKGLDLGYTSKSWLKGQHSEN